jgi:hypothetical protein
MKKTVLIICAFLIMLTLNTLPGSAGRDRTHYRSDSSHHGPGHYRGSQYHPGPRYSHHGPGYYRGSRYYRGPRYSYGGNIWIGPGWWDPWRGYPYYPYTYSPYPYYYPYYSAPPAIQRQQPIYIEPAPEQEEQNYWYYCPKPEGYYPYIKKCPEGWLRVVPSPVPQDGGE